MKKRKTESKKKSVSLEEAEFVGTASLFLIKIFSSILTVFLFSVFTVSVLHFFVCFRFSLCFSLVCFMFLFFHALFLLLQSLFSFLSPFICLFFFPFCLLLCSSLVLFLSFVLGWVYLIFILFFVCVLLFLFLLAICHGFCLYYIFIFFLFSCSHNAILQSSFPAQAWGLVLWKRAAKSRTLYQQTIPRRRKY